MCRSQVCKLAVSGCSTVSGLQYGFRLQYRFRLQYLRQFRREGALGFVVAFFSTATVVPVTLFRSGPCCPCRYWCCRGCSRWFDYTFRRLCRVGPKDLVFERGSVETANNRLHFVRSGCLHKSEAFRLLRFVVPDHLYRIRDKVFSGEPLLNVVGCDPNG